MRLTPFILILGWNAWAKLPLVDASQAHDRAAVLRLIEQKSDVNAAEADGTTALHWAAHYGDLDLVDRLLKAGAQATVTNTYGATPLTEAAVTGSAALLERLLKAGANPDSANADGETVRCRNVGLKTR